MIKSKEIENQSINQIEQRNINNNILQTNSINNKLYKNNESINKNINNSNSINQNKIPLNKDIKQTYEIKKVNDESKKEDMCLIS